MSVITLYESLMGNMEEVRSVPGVGGNSSVEVGPPALLNNSNSNIRLFLHYATSEFDRMMNRSLVVLVV